MTTTFVKNFLNASLTGTSPTENLVTCPIGLLLLLSTLLGSGGPKGSTATQIAKALSINQAGDAREIEKGALFLYRNLSSSLTSHRIETEAGTVMPVITLSNGIFVHKTLCLHKAYVLNVKKNFQAAIRNVDFGNSGVQRATNTINNWVNMSSDQLIPRLFPNSGALTDTKLLLLNILTFKDNWHSEFFTPKLGQFNLSPRDYVTVPMMRNEMDMPYINNETLGFSAVQVPMKNRRFSFVVTLPINPEDMRGTEKLLRGEYSIKAIFENVGQINVEIELPKFNLSATANLLKMAENMGIHDLFDSNKVDLSGITQVGKVGVNKLEQALALNVDEYGVKAAAATYVGAVPLMNLESVKFHANRPFVCIIYDSELDIPIISARVMDPSHP